VVKGGIGEFSGGVAMREEMLLEETKLLMKLVEEVLREVGAGEVDEEERRAIEERVRKAVKKLREKHISRVLV
jgi:ElaB/YqjD/DUF883 family membrane-anchored ribosome-binding protein